MPLWQYVVQGVLVLMTAWYGSMLLELRDFRASTTGNRWTSTDQAAYAIEIQREHQMLQDRISAVAQRIPAEVPPTWFIERVQRIEVEAVEIRKRLEKLEDEFRRHIIIEQGSGVPRHSHDNMQERVNP